MTYEDTSITLDSIYRRACIMGRTIKYFNCDGETFDEYVKEFKARFDPLMNIEQMSQIELTFPHTTNGSGYITLYRVPMDSIGIWAVLE